MEVYVPKEETIQNPRRRTKWNENKQSVQERVQNNNNIDAKKFRRMDTLRILMQLKDKKGDQAEL